jgi:hypothetical protein
MRERETSPTVDDIETSEHYDQEDDIYYVTVKTGEPSIVVEHDDHLLIEMGIFTRMPTGFRILNYAKQKAPGGAFRDAFKQFCKNLGLRKIKSDLEKRHRRLDKSFEKAIA